MLFANAAVAFMLGVLVIMALSVVIYGVKVVMGKAAPPWRELTSQPRNRFSSAEITHIGGLLVFGIVALLLFINGQQFGASLAQWLSLLFAFPALLHLFALAAPKGD